MIINFGYVAMSKILKDCSPSKTTTVKYLSRIDDKEVRINKLRTLAKTNLKNTQRLFYHNDAHDIKLFRLTSKLIPLATHPIAEAWDWAEDMKGDLKSLGNYAREHNFRISAHPDHFTLLNSPREDVLKASLRDLEYHNKIFAAMNLDASAKLVIHVGGSYGSKNEATNRFVQNYIELPSHLKKRIVLENDDKIFTTQDVLKICQKLMMPMVLDIHHHWCNNDGDNIQDSLQAVFSTWRNEEIPPKIHVSSPKDEKNFRHHADNIDDKFFLDFLYEAKKIDIDFDVMIEAKNKDAALFKLMEELKGKKGIKLINKASIEM